jgi:hypothetical protein
MNTIPDGFLRSDRGLPLWTCLGPLLHSLHNQPDASETQEDQGFIMNMFCRQSQQQTKLVQMVAFLNFMAFQAIEQDVLWTEMPIDF